MKPLPGPAAARRRNTGQIRIYVIVHPAMWAEDLGSSGSAVRVFSHRSRRIRASAHHKIAYRA